MYFYHNQDTPVTCFLYFLDAKKHLIGCIIGHTDDLNHSSEHRGRMPCRRGGTYGNSLSYGDDMILAPTVTASQTLLDVRHSYVDLHDIVTNTMKTVRMLVRPRQFRRLHATGVMLGHDELIVTGTSWVSWSCSFFFRLLLKKKNITTSRCRKTIQDLKWSW